MGDSDDDYDRRKGRDKFKQERRDFESGGSRSRQQSDRSPPPQGGGGGGYGAPRRQYHHSSSSRNDYYYHERTGGGGGGGGGGGSGGGGYDAGPPYKRPRRDDAPPPPPSQGADGDGGWASGGGRSQGRYNYQREGPPPPPLMPPPGSAAPAAPPPPHLMQQAPPMQPPPPVQQVQHASSNTLKTFKQFLLEQDDGITEQEALTRYRSYKEEFVRRQLAEFFDAHKSEEWFKEKYHPDYYEDNQRRCRDNVNRRLRAFEKLQSLGLLDGRVVHIDQARELVRFMDSLVILLEGGCSEDFEILDAQPESAADADADADMEEGEEKQERQEKKFPTKSTPAPAVPAASAPTSADVKNAAPADAAEAVGGGEGAGKSTKSKKSRRKSAADDNDKEDASSTSSSSSSNNSSSSSSESSDSSSSSDSDNSDAEGETKDERKKAKSSKSAAAAAESAVPAALPVSVQGYSSAPPTAEPSADEPAAKPAEPQSSQTATPTPVDADAADVAGSVASGEAKDSDSEQAATCSALAEAPVAVAAPLPPPVAASTASTVEKIKPKQEKELKEKAEDVEQGELRLPRRPRPLHRTQSIFLRNLHPSITRSEVETLCKAYPGFMRLALQDPAPERKFFRRGWITFQHDVNIKEICWNLNNIRLKECDLGAIVNRELSQRVRPIMTVANHRTVMRQDIRLAARIVQQLDAKCGLYIAAANGGRASPKQQPMLMPQLPADIPVTMVGASSSAVVAGASANPLLKNLAEFIVDEGSYEEEALLGGASFDSHSSGDTEVKIEIEAPLQAKLDRLIFYLRAVHSVDFYSATEYPNEDDMPHRCGIMHARGAVTMPDKPILQREVDNYMHEFEAKVQCLTQYVNPIVTEDAKKLGLRDEEAAVDKFVQDNTKELGQDKWLCPLSGKKFKGPEFIKKHIFNKHQSAVDNVRKDVQYFNNYIKDPKRPHVADQSQQPTQQQQPPPQYMQQQQQMGGRPGYQPRGGRDFEYGGGHYGSYNRYDQGRRPDYYGGGYPQQQPRDYGGARGGYYNDNAGRYGGGYGQRGGYRGGGGGIPEGRPVRPMAPGGRKLITYTDLDAPEDF